VDWLIWSRSNSSGGGIASFLVAALVSKVCIRVWVRNWVHFTCNDKMCCHVAHARARQGGLCIVRSITSFHLQAGTRVRISCKAYPFAVMLEACTFVCLVCGPSTPLRLQKLVWGLGATVITVPSAFTKITGGTVRLSVVVVVRTQPHLGCCLAHNNGQTDRGGTRVSL
jgi:hypothetical protein